MLVEDGLKRKSNLLLAKWPNARIVRKAKRNLHTGAVLLVKYLRSPRDTAV